MNSWKELFLKARNAAHWAIYISDDFRMFNLDAGIRLYRNLLANLQWIFGKLLTDQEQLKETGIEVDPVYAAGMLKELLNAQEQKDYVLLADLLELQVYPFMTQIMEMLRQAEIWDVQSGEENAQAPNPAQADMAVQDGFWEDWFHENLKVIEKKDKQLAERLLQHSGVMHAHREAGRAVGEESYRFEEICYHIEPTSVGYPTCRIEKDGESYYLHSNKNPFTEARRWEKELLDDQSTAYVLMGIGLGYPGVVLNSCLAGNFPVHVYESDLCLLWLAVRYCRMDVAIKQNLYLHYDPTCENLAKAAGEPGYRLCIHYPSLRGIREEAIRNRFESFFIQDSSFRNAKLLLKGNFHANLRGYREEPERILLVDNLKERFRGKTVFIIAAGPSLDKNIARLKQWLDTAGQEDCFVIAVGTVFRKLLQMGIRPDFVIVSEANMRALAQIRGLEQAGVPMLMLSTAHHGFMSDYPATHYLIFQKDYPPAEEAAGDYQTSLYQTGGSVSTTALDVAIRLGAANIVFLGLDLAFTDNLAHAEDTSNRVATDSADLIAVKAQDGGVVYADHKFIIYREWIERRICQPDAGMARIINATEGGSYIQGMKHLPLQTVLDALQNGRDL